MNIIKQMWYIFDTKQKLRLGELFLLILVGTLLETLGVTMIVPFISTIMYPEKVLKNDLAGYVYEKLHLTSVEQFVIILALLLIVVYMCKNLYLIWMYHVQFRFVYNNQRRLSHRLMACYLKQPYEFHLQHNSAELQTNVFTEVEYFFSTVLYLINVITDGCVCIALALLLFVTDKSITLGAIGLILVFILTFYRWYKKESLRLGQERKEYAQVSIKNIQQSFGGIKEIKVLEKEEFFENNYIKAYKRMLEARRKVNTYGMAPKPLLETICIIALLLVVSIKILRGVDMEYFIPTLSVFALAVIRILPSSSRLTSNISNVIFGKASVEAIYNDIKEIEELQNKARTDAEQIREITFEKEIEIRDLEFQYQNSDRKVLDKINLKIPKNKSVALIGPSGSGKTTLADIILGVLQYQKGSVMVDGVEIKDSTVAWHKKVGYIPQNIYITDDTIRRNVAFAMDDNEIDDAKIWEALEEAQLKDFVEGLPDGLDTIIGERGARISGGQRQRIGVARALYRNSEVLVLDEATSALDNDTEKAIMQSIDALNGRKTLVIIAHRITTIENCDYVYRVEDGKVKLERA